MRGVSESAKAPRGPAPRDPALPTLEQRFEEYCARVSPIAMDDVTSGSNLSLRPEFNELLGFTEADVRGMVETYRDLGVFDQDPDAALDTMREWYDGYRFAEDADSVVYNTDMVLYYLQHSLPNKPGPRNLIDDNVRIDYGKLRQGAGAGVLRVGAGAQRRGFG